MFLNMSMRVALLAFLTIPNDIIAGRPVVGDRALRKQQSNNDFFIANEEDPLINGQYPLMAGQDTLIGQVVVTSNENCSINVEYIIDDESDFCITQTHLVSLNRNPQVGSTL
jgi:hypothetical protein